MSKIIEAVEINEKSYKNKFGEKFSTKKKLGETDFYDIWLAQDSNAGIQVVLLANKEEPTKCIALTYDEVTSLPTILKKAMSFIDGSDVSEGKSDSQLARDYKNKKLTFDEYLDFTRYEGFADAASGLSDDEYYELEDEYNDWLKKKK